MTSVLRSPSPVARRPSSLRIAIAVHGRFHAFDLARELLRRGHDVTLFTNYPKFAVARFGVPPERVRSLVSHGVISRAAQRLREQVGILPEILSLSGPLG